MPVTRIKENQLTDSAVTNAKVADATLAGGKLAANLTYGSNLTVTGNLTVSGTTTTVDTTTTTVTDPIMVLASDQTGSGAKDIGFIGERGDDTNVFIGWDESEDKFIVATTSSADSSTTVTVTDHADMQMGGLTVDDALGVSGESTLASAIISDLTATRVVLAGTSGAIEDSSNLTFDGSTLAVTGAITGTTTAAITGNINGGNLTTAGLTDTATLHTSGEATLASAIVEDLTENQILVPGSGGALESTNKLTFDETTLAVTGAITASTTAAITGNINGGNLTTTGLTDSATLHTSGLATMASAVVETLTDNQVVVSGTSGAVESTSNLTFDETTLGVTGAITATTTAVITGNVTGGNLITAGLVSSTGNVTGGNLVTAGSITDGALISSDGTITGGVAATFSGQISGGSLTTAGGLNVDGTSTLAAITVDASSTIDMGDNKVTNVTDPTGDQDAATKKYVDDLLSSGFTLSDGATTQAIAQGDTLLLQGTANEVNVAVSATDTMTIGLPDDVTIGDTLTVTGNLVVNGTTTTVNTATSVLQDPIFQLGRGADNAALASDDNKDRGLDMFYYDSSTEKRAFMGWDNSELAFTFNSEATNTAEVIGGTLGKIIVGEIAVDNIKIDGRRIESTDTGGNLELVAEGAGKVTLPTGNELVITDAANTGIAFSTSGEMTFDATNLYYDGTELSAKNINSDGYVAATGNVSGGNVISAALTDTATLHTSGEATLASAIVEDLTENQVLVPGSGGALESTNKLTFDETTLGVTGAITATTTAVITGNITGGNLITSGLASVTGNITGGNLITAGIMDSATIHTSGEATLASAIVEDLTENQVLVPGAGGALESTDKLTFDESTLAVTGAITASTNITATATVTGATVTDGVASINSGAITSATTGSFSGTVTAGAFNDGAATYDAGTISSGVAATFSGAVQGATVTGTTSVAGGNITISGDDITSSNGKVVINDASGDVDFIVESNGNTGMLVVDGGADSVSIGTATQTTDCTFKISATDSMMIPAGTTAQRPASGVAGMIRYNSTNDGIEYYDTSESSFKSLTAEFTVITGETFDGDGSETGFTLGSSQTTASCIVSINGVVQLPTTAYAVSGTTLTFTEAPASGDKIEVRQLTTSSTITGLANGDSSISIEMNSDKIDVKGNLVPITDDTYALGSPTNKWKDIYVSASTIHLGGIQLKESGGAMVTTDSGGSTPAPQSTDSITKSGSDGVGNIGQSDNSFNTVHAKATSAQYADLAEKYEADADYDEGTVVMFGGDKEVTICGSSNCKAIAGIISTSPAYSMNDGLEADNVAVVALVGRVPCKVTGSIKKGDLMVSAGDGKAKADNGAGIGEVIGKALADSEGEGVIEVVVKH